MMVKRMLLAMGAVVVFASAAGATERIKGDFLEGVDAEWGAGSGCPIMFHHKCYRPGEQGVLFGILKKSEVRSAADQGHPYITISVKGEDGKERDITMLYYGADKEPGIGSYTKAEFTMARGQHPAALFGFDPATPDQE